MAGYCGRGESPSENRATNRITLQELVILRNRTPSQCFEKEHAKRHIQSSVSHEEHVGHPPSAAENKNGIIPTYSHVHPDPHLVGNVG